MNIEQAAQESLRRRGRKVTECKCEEVLPWMEDQLWNWPRVQVVCNPAKESLNIIFFIQDYINQMKPCSTTIA